MKVIWVSNGSLSLSIVPETELEKQLTRELFKGRVDTTIVEKMQILNNSLVDVVIISPLQSKTEKQDG